MEKAISLPDVRSLLMASADDNKHSRSRMKLYLEWMEETNRTWLNPDLPQYATYLTERGLAPVSINSYIGTLRMLYKDLLNTLEFRDLVYQTLPIDASISDKKATLDEVERRIEIGISSRTSFVKEIVVQDENDYDHVRLTKGQANALLESPGTDSLKGLRDTAMIAVMLCTGIRVEELSNLNVSDLDHHLNGCPALLVQHGKGGKRRIIPYGESDWCVTVTRFWLDNIGITEGAVFRPFWKGSKRIRDGRITTRSIERVLKRYPVSINGNLRALEPHDLRRTYARLMYESGMDVVAIKQNLGHSDMSTTLRYIGALDADRRRSPAVYRFNLMNLKSVV